jgi:rSAM/selenodomain-associated transferase 1
VAPGSRAVIVMAKEPRPGLVKTRLAPELSPGLAAALYRAFLLDVLATTRTVARADLFCFVHPAASVGWFREAAGPRYEVRPQVGTLLSERMIAAFAELFARGFRAVVMRNSDSPTLPAAAIEESLDALDRGCGFALGPDRGGGYYLVGMTAPHPELLRGVTMSTTSVRDETLRRARALGLRTHLAPSWLDVDTPEDLALLRQQLDPSQRVERAVCEHTETFLATLPRMRHRFPAEVVPPPSGAADPPEPPRVP